MMNHGMNPNMNHPNMNPNQMMPNQNPHMNMTPQMMNQGQNSMMNPMNAMAQPNTQIGQTQNTSQNPMNQMQGVVGSQQQQQQPQQDAERNRFIAELEFVQCLANPNYICFLAQHGYFKKPEFINYIKYLEVKYPLSRML